MGERRRETEREREREGGVKQMYQNCIPTMNMNTLCIVYYTCFYAGGALRKNLLFIREFHSHWNGAKGMNVDGFVEGREDGSGLSAVGGRRWSFFLGGKGP